MARTGISQEQVFEAVETLMQTGDSVTVSSVREHLGSGSYSTISTHLAKWREANDNRKTPDYPDMPDNVDKAFRQVWAMSWKNAQETIQAEREALVAARKQMEQEQQDMATEIARLETEAGAHADELKNLSLVLSDKENALSEAQNANNGLKGVK